MKTCAAIIDACNRVLGWLAGLCIVLASALILAEIASRLALGQSLHITDEYTGYFMAVSSMLGLGYIEKTHGHIRMDLIDLLRVRFPKMVRAMRIGAYGMAAMFAAYLTCVGWRLFYQSYLYGSKSMKMSETPLALQQFCVPLGAAALFLQYLCNMYKAWANQAGR